MKNKLLKYLYIFTRGTSIFSLPYIRRIRVHAYEQYFNCQNFFIVESVIIVPSHYHKDSYIKIGNHVSIASFSLIDYSGNITIGDHCTISEGVKIYSHTHKLTPNTLTIKQTKIIRSNIDIGDYVWIGANALILPSVTKIGRGSVIGAGSVVTRNVSEWEVVAGNPAKVISKREIDKGLL